MFPIMVNGYLIFFFKKFFDSLPRYLSKAALLDSTSNTTITMFLSKPILADVAL